MCHRCKLLSRLGALKDTQNQITIEGVTLQERFNIIKSGGFQDISPRIQNQLNKYLKK